MSFGVTHSTYYENNGEGKKKGLSYKLILALAPGATEKPLENSTVSALHSQIFFFSVGFVQSLQNNMIFYIFRKCLERCFLNIIILVSNLRGRSIWWAI